MVIWCQTYAIGSLTQITREETCCCHMGYSFRLAARVLLYAPSHRQDSTYHSLCYTSHGALAGTRNSSMDPPWRIDPTTHCTMNERSYHRAISRSPVVQVLDWSVVGLKSISIPLGVYHIHISIQHAECIVKLNNILLIYLNITPLVYH